MSKTAKQTKTTEPCECRNWEIGEDVEIDGEPDVTIITTGCTATTRKTFAPGHDAKLKALLIRAGVEGLDVRYGRASGVVVTTDVEGAAKRFDFGYMVLRGVQKELAKRQARDERAANRVAKAAKAKPVKATPKAPEPKRALIQHGRWTYEAQVTADGTATYRARGNNRQVVVPAGKYKVVGDVAPEEGAPAAPEVAAVDNTSPELKALIGAVREARSAR